MPTALIRVVVVLALVPTALSTAVAPLTTCETPGTVNEGQSAFVNCDYSQDLTRDRPDFYVYRVHNDSAEPVLITMCQWERNGWSCDTDESYRVETANIGNQVTIEIPSAKQDLSGTYFCKTVSADWTSRSVGCDLTVRRIEPITCETPGIVVEGEPAFLTCNYNLDLNKRRQDFYVYRFQEEGGEPAIITLCGWDGDRLNCETNKDYALTTVITKNHATLDILAARPIHSGKYMCKTFPGDKALSKSEECSLRVLSAGQILPRFGSVPFIILSCVVVVLLALSLVLLVRQWNSVAQRCTCSLYGCGHGYSILRDQNETSNGQVFVVPIEKNSVPRH